MKKWTKKAWLRLGIFVVMIGILFYAYHHFWESSMHVQVPESKITKEVKTAYQERVSSFHIQASSENATAKYSKQNLVQFLQNKMLVQGRFITNYKAHKDQSKSDLAVGHDSLVESSGLWLRYLALTGKEVEYWSFYQKTKQLFYRDGQFSYRLNANGDLSPVNASIDDLRIMRSLLEANARFKSKKYMTEFQTLAQKFTGHCLPGKVLVDFYDTKQQQASTVVSLYYLNLKTLAFLYQTQKIPLKYLEYQYNILKNGYISDLFPFYRAQYDYRKKAYVKKEKINVIESLLSILYLCEIGAEKKESIAYIKERVTTGTLYNAYDENGQVVDKNQSAASYAIVAMIAKEIRDDFLYQQAMNILRNFQVLQKNSPIFGGIGNPNTLEVFSYNNLMALLAYCY